MSNPEQNSDIYKLIRRLRDKEALALSTDISTGALIGGLGSNVALNAYNESTLTPEDRTAIKGAYKKWDRTPLLNQAKDMTSVVGNLFPSKEYKELNTARRKPLEDRGIYPNLAMNVSALAGGTIAGGITAKKLGMFSYMNQ